MVRAAGWVLMAWLAADVHGSDWPAWRGASGNGEYMEKDLPLRWSASENVRWHTALPDRGNSTPIVSHDRVFITQAVEKTGSRAVLCFDRRNGSLLWQSGSTWTEPETTHPENPFCSSSPVTDGRRVIAWFGSAGIHCLDFQGRELWRRDLGRQSHAWGYASSPVLSGSLCFLNFGPGSQSFVIALDKRTGKTVWQQEVPAIRSSAKWEEFGGEAKAGGSSSDPTVSDVAGSWGTPLVVRAGRRDELVIGLALWCVAFDLRTGQALWTCDGPNIGAYSSPFFGEGTIVLNGSGLKNTVLAIQPGGFGDVTGTRRRWLKEVGFGKTCVGAGVVRDGHIYQVGMSGFAECRSLKSGEIVWEERLTGTGARQGSWSAPLLAGDHLYVANRNADVFVLRASPTFEILATNSIGGEPMNASLAASDGDIFLRTEKQLWCVAASKESTGASSKLPSRK